MKVTPEHAAALKAMLDELLIDLNIDLDQAQARFRKAEEEGERAQMRARWNTLYSVLYAKREPLITAIYQYANDDHIDTVLRQWVRELLARKA
jgi:hypothetical protein